MSQCKRISLVKRATDVPAARFGELWRADAVRSLESLDQPRPHRLAHAVVRHGRHPAAWDGVAISWLDEAVPAAASSAVIDPSATTTIVVTERQAFGADWLQGTLTSGKPVSLVIGFIQRAQRLTSEEFRQYWWDVHRPLANRMIPTHLQPSAYVHNYVTAPETFEWDGIGELYETVDVARARAEWFDSDAAEAIIADENEFLVRATRWVLVTEIELLTSP